MKLKFNGGHGALLCDHCGIVIATGNRIPDEAFNIGPDDHYYFCCASCAVKWHYELDKKISVIVPETGMRPKMENL